MRQDEFLTEFDQMFAELAKRARIGRFEPNADVLVEDDGGHVVVNVELAGADADELRVGIDAGHLLILGRRTERTNGVRRGSLTQKEIQYGDFIKKVRLPVPVRFEEATGTYQDGMLLIRLPIATAGHQYRPTHRTEIRMIVRRTSL